MHNKHARVCYTYCAGVTYDYTLLVGRIGRPSQPPVVPPNHRSSLLTTGGETIHCFSAGPVRSVGRPAVRPSLVQYGRRMTASRCLRLAKSWRTVNSNIAIMYEHRYTTYVIRWREVNQNGCTRLCISVSGERASGPFGRQALARSGGMETRRSTRPVN